VPAPRGNKYGKGSQTSGRPSLYRSQYAEIAKKLCEEGATNGDLARAFRVNVSTIKEWCARYEAFSTATRVGKAIADDLVERALFQRCIGYDFDFDLGRGRSVIRHLPPDVSAIRLWLFNRRPARWKEKVEVERTGGWADRSPDEIKKELIRKMLKWNLIDPSRVPPNLLPAPDGTIDDDN
jgi:hypothetical protein